MSTRKHWRGPRRRLRAPGPDPSRCFFSQSESADLGDRRQDFRFWLWSTSRRLAAPGCALSPIHLSTCLAVLPAFPDVATHRFVSSPSGGQYPRRRVGPFGNPDPRRVAARWKEADPHSTRSGPAPGQPAVFLNPSSVGDHGLHTDKRNRGCHSTRRAGAGSLRPSCSASLCSASGWDENRPADFGVSPWSDTVRV